MRSWKALLTKYCAAMRQLTLCRPESIYALLCQMITNHTKPCRTLPRNTLPCQPIPYYRKNKGDLKGCQPSIKTTYKAGKFLFI